jgi:hypothetical protein
VTYLQQGLRLVLHALHRVHQFQQVLLDVVTMRRRCYRQRRTINRLGFPILGRAQADAVLAVLKVLGIFVGRATGGKGERSR